MPEAPSTAQITKDKIGNYMLDPSLWEDDWETEHGTKLPPPKLIIVEGDPKSSSHEVARAGVCEEGGWGVFGVSLYFSTINPIKTQLDFANYRVKE